MVKHITSQAYDYLMTSVRSAQMQLFTHAVTMLLFVQVTCRSSWHTGSRRMPESSGVQRGRTTVPILPQLPGIAASNFGTATVSMTKRSQCARCSLNSL